MTKGFKLNKRLTLEAGAYYTAEVKHINASTPNIPLQVTIKKFVSNSFTFKMFPTI